MLRVRRKMREAAPRRCAKMRGNASEHSDPAPIVALRAHTQRLIPRCGAM